MEDQVPDQAPPPYPGAGAADKAYPPGSAPYPPQQQAPYPPPAGYPPQGQPGYPPQGQPGYPPQGQPAEGYPPQPASYQQPYPQQGGYPAGPGVPPPGVGGQQTVVVSQPAHTVTTVVQHFGDAPSNTKCPNCQNQVTTQVSHEPGTMAWLACFLMFIFGLWLCCCIPFCVDGMQNANHHCPVCKYRIATYSR